MPDPERPDIHSHPDDCFRPTPLPPELADFLKDQDYACLTQGTDRGTVLVIKTPGVDIVSVRGRVPILLRQELYDHPAAPVIRLVVTIFDQPERTLALETFLNIADTQQRADFAALATQDELPMLFYDEALLHRLTKVVPYHDQAVVPQILAYADHRYAAIPTGQFNFDQAKAEVMAGTRL